MTLIERLEKAVRIVPDFPMPGIRFKDITPMLRDPALMRETAQALAEPFMGKGVTAVVGIESRGFLLGPLIAQQLNCGFIIVRKKGKLPPETNAVSYTLEYGNATIEMSRGALTAADNVVVHDDLLATGGTGAACAELTRQLGANVVGFNFLIELEFLKGRRALARYSENVVSLMKYAS